MGNKKEIIAVVGMCGAGKSVVSDFFVDRGYKFLRFGQITLDEVRERGGLESNQGMEKEIRERNRKEHGMAAYAILNKSKIDSLLEQGNVVIDGLYSWSEYKYLKDVYSDSLNVLAVIASPELRYNRLEERVDIDEDMRNRPLVRRDSKSRDYAEIENIEKAGPISMADFVVVNEGSINELISKLDGIFSDASSRRPSWDEYFMEFARTAAKRATCNRGRSGCVIVRDNQILTTGYVGAPAGLPHCDDVGHEMRTVIYDDESRSQHCVRTAHAEQNAVYQAAKLGIALEGSTLYCKMTPCETCSGMIINSGIIRVIAEKDYHRGTKTKNMFKQAGIGLDILDEQVETYKNM